MPNSPDLALFDPTVLPHRGFREDGSLRVVYTGALTPTYELDVSLDAVARLAALRPDLDVRLELYGRGDSEETLREQAARLGIAERVTFHGRIPIEDVPAAVARADIGIAPTRLDDFTRVSLSTKVFEYGAMGKPVVASRLPLVERTFPEGTVAAYEPGDPAAMAAAILGFVDDPIVREAAVTRTTADHPGARLGARGGPLRRSRREPRADRGRPDEPSVMDRPSLAALAAKHGTDKGGAHFYAGAYERHLMHLRDRPIRLLEIGIGGYSDPQAGGESLRMWKEYFAEGEIFGLDIHDKSTLAEERITILRGDQSDPVLLERIGRDHGPFDVIVDDGSHISAHIIASFKGLFRHLADDGIYAIEDLQTSYWQSYGGSSGRDRRGTSMTFLQALVDGLNHAEYDLVDYHPTFFDEWVVGVTFYHNLAFVQKGDNREPSTLLPPHPRPRRMMDGKPKGRRTGAWPHLKRRVRRLSRRVRRAP